MSGVLYGYNGQRILVSPEDYELLSTRGLWSTSGNYAVSMWWGRQVPMHRIVLENKLGRELLKDEFVDHINGDRFDNRRENLRLVTTQQNSWNSRPGSNSVSGYIGVWYDKRFNTYRAHVIDGEHRIYLGTFDNAEDAAYMRDQFAYALRGEYAYLNVLDK